MRKLLTKLQTYKPIDWAFIVAYALMVAFVCYGLVTGGSAK